MSLKVIFGKEAKRTLKIPSNIFQLHFMTVGMFPALLNQKYVCKYIDEDGDLITVADDQDLIAMKNTMGPNYQIIIYEEKHAGLDLVPIPDTELSREFEFKELQLILNNNIDEEKKVSDEEVVKKKDKPIIDKSVKGQIEEEKDTFEQIRNELKNLFTIRKGLEEFLTDLRHQIETFEVECKPSLENNELLNEMQGLKRKVTSDHSKTCEKIEELQKKLHQSSQPIYSNGQFDLLHLLKKEGESKPSEQAIDPTKCGHHIGKESELPCLLPHFGPCTHQRKIKDPEYPKEIHERALKFLEVVDDSIPLFKILEIVAQNKGLSDEEIMVNILNEVEEANYKDDDVN
eukprot:TRINITY_DN6650_c0_g1_i3.p1 TRINITY_DN6650_c0_g1~~TRINITY_DN6650_c0_g1_i3.p1  ORF type:complete len:345 (-),score=100.47 TRINITY_DN6650_c0_g1_i3:69-1103(-)